MDTGEEIYGYCAVNFLGCIDAVDMEASQYRLEFGDPNFTGSITIDTAKVHNIEAFRLSNGPGFVVLSERVAKAIEKKDFKAVLLQPTTDYSGT